jgi:hypothetical protein
MSAPAERRIVIKLMPEYGAGSLWVSLDGGIFDVYDVAEITEIVPLSAELLAALAAWDERFQATFNEEYPPDSAFPTPEGEAAFVAEGAELARRIRGEVPDSVTVISPR